MKKIIVGVLLIVGILLNSCDINFVIEEYSDKEMEVFEYLLTDSTNDLHKNVIEKIEYMEDKITWNKKEYFQTPYQTAMLKTGDCEDKGLLFMFLLKQYFNIDSEMIIIDDLNDWHAVINILEDDTCNIIENSPHLTYGFADVGCIYDTYYYSTYPSISNIIEVFDYNELMYYSEKYHEMPFYRYLDGKDKSIFIQWAEKKEEFIKQYGEIKEEDLVAQNWDRLEKMVFRFIIDLAGYY